MCIFSKKVFPAQDLIILDISSSLPESHTSPFLLFLRAHRRCSPSREVTPTCPALGTLIFSIALCRKPCGACRDALNLPPRGFQSPLDGFATRRGFSTSTDASSYLPSNPCRNKNSVMKMELATALIAGGTTNLMGLGAGVPCGLTATGESPLEHFFGSKGGRRGLCAEPGSTGRFLEAAQVELVNYKMPHSRAVI